VLRSFVLVLIPHQRFGSATLPLKIRKSCGLYSQVIRVGFRSLSPFHSADSMESTDGLSVLWQTLERASHTLGIGKRPPGPARVLSWRNIASLTDHRSCRAMACACYRWLIQTILSWGRQPSHPVWRLSHDPRIRRFPVKEETA